MGNFLEKVDVFIRTCFNHYRRCNVPTQLPCRLQRNGDEKSVDSEREIFIQDVRDRYVTPMQVGNDNVQLMGRPNNEDKEKRLRGKLLRDSLSQALADHDMKRRRKNWTENEYSHVVINS